MRWKRLEGDRELATYKAAFEAATGFHVTREELERFLVFGAWEKGALAGGFWIIAEPPYRTIQSIPAAYAAADPILARLAGSPAVEMGGLWKSRSLGRAAQTASFFLRGAALALRHIPARSRLLFGYDHRVDHLRFLYRSAEPHVLYRGPLSAPGSAGGETIHATVCLMSRGEFVRGVLGSLAPIAVRAVTRRKRPRSREAPR